MDTAQSLLPGLIQRNLHRILSLRRAVGRSRTTSTRQTHGSPVTTLSADAGLAEVEHVAHKQNPFDDRPQSSCSSTSTETSSTRSLFSSGYVNSPGIEESETGIRWRYVDEGHTTLNRALLKATATSQEPELTRSMYMDGMMYLLQALPPDLTNEEYRRLREATLSRLGAQEGTEILQSRFTTSDEPSTVRRAAATFTSTTILAARFTLPYVQGCVRSVYDIERKYDISHRLLDANIAAVQTSSKQIAFLVNKVCEAGNSKAGQRLKLYLIWCLQEATQGACEGCSDIVDKRISVEAL